MGNGAGRVRVVLGMALLLVMSQMRGFLVKEYSRAIWMAELVEVAVQVGVQQRVHFEA